MGGSLAGSVGLAPARLGGGGGAFVTGHIDLVILWL